MEKKQDNEIMGGDYMLRAAIYARFSSDNQREESIDAQIRAIEEFCKKNNYKVTKTYTDEALSARTDDRPRFLEMVSDSKSGLFDVIICHKLDRFSRNRYDSAFYKKKLAENNVRLISVLENLDDSPESIILESVLEGMAEYYSANLSREVQKGQKENALDCRHNGGKPPFGFDVNEDKYYIVNEYEAKAVKHIFNMIVNKDTVGNVIKWLNKHDYKTIYGNKFTPTALNAIIRNEKYKGTYAFGKYKRVKQNGVWKDIPGDSIVIENGVPKIVSEEVWEKANAIFDKRKRNVGGQATAKENYLLSGLIACGKCGANMNGNRNKGGRSKTLRVTYRCNTRKSKKTCDMKDIRKDLVEGIVINELDEILTDTVIDIVVNEIMNRIKEMSSQIPNELKELKRELKKIDKPIDSLVQAIADGLYSPSVKDKLDNLERKKQDIVDRIDFYERQMELVELPSREFILNHFKKDMDIKTKSDDDKKRIINNYIKKVVVYDDHVEVYSSLVVQGSTPLNRNRDVDTLMDGSAPCNAVTSENGLVPIIVSKYLYEQPKSRTPIYKKLNMEYA